MWVPASAVLSAILVAGAIGAVPSGEYLWTMAPRYSCTVNNPFGGTVSAESGVEQFVFDAANPISSYFRVLVPTTDGTSGSTDWTNVAPSTATYNAGANTISMTHSSVLSFGCDLNYEASLALDGQGVLVGTFTLSASGGSFVDCSNCPVRTEPCAFFLKPPLSPKEAGYELMYEFEVPEEGIPFHSSQPVPYLTDNSAVLAGRGFGTDANARVAYLMELNNDYGWASFDNIDTDLGRLGVPINLLQYVKAQSVQNMNVRRSGGGAGNSDGASTGSIEFSGFNYDAQNTRLVPGASDAAFDHGDNMQLVGNHGSMQIFEGATPVMCYSGFGQPTYSMGVGANPNAAGAPDWTFEGHAQYALRRISVWMQCNDCPVTGNPTMLTEAPTVAPTFVGVRYPANDPKILQIGRFVDVGDGSLRFDHPATQLSFRVGGGVSSVRLEITQQHAPGNACCWPEPGTNAMPNYFLVLVDGAKVGGGPMGDGFHTFSTEELESDVPFYYLLEGLDPSVEHDITLFKNTEAHWNWATCQDINYVTAHSIVLDTGSLLDPPARRPRRLEFFGDSITAGFEILCNAAPALTGAAAGSSYDAWPNVLCDLLNAECNVAAWSGFGMAKSLKAPPPNLLPVIANRTLATDDNAQWDFAQWKPDAVIINLGTNDNSAGVVWADYVSEYTRFVSQLAGQYESSSLNGDNKIHFFLACGPMTDAYCPYVFQVIAAVRSLGVRATFLDSRGVGSSGCPPHPSLADNLLLAAAARPTVATMMGWETPPPLPGGCPRGVVAAEGQSFGENGEFAFDGNTATKWLDQGGGDGTTWIEVEFPYPVRIETYSISSANDYPERDPMQWNLLGDGTVIHSVNSDQLWDQRFQEKSFTIPPASVGLYSVYRMQFTAIRDMNQGFCNCLQLSEIQFNCVDTPTEAPTPSPTVQPSANPSTSQPTPNPTTASPTAIPTSNPTTENPTAAPTQVPTQVPSSNPTAGPTANPTNVPTFRPSNPGDSSSPTRNPTTVNPSTNNPTVSPTTGNPTTANPTTAYPTTANPTATPSDDPTANPTTTNPTTFNPTTSNPTAIQNTGNPTVPSSAAPSSSPSTRPPSGQPTGNPTDASSTTTAAGGQGGQGDTAQGDSLSVEMVVLYFAGSVMLLCVALYCCIVKPKGDREDFRKEITSMLKREAELDGAEEMELGKMEVEELDSMEEMEKSTTQSSLDDL